MVDANGNGVADELQTLWMLPPGASELAPVLAAAGDTLDIKVKISVTQAPPAASPCACPCAIM